MHMSATANKASLGTPSQFWVQRFIDKVTITLYPLPNATAASNFINVYYVKRIDDTGAYTNASDTPFRFVPCMIIRIILLLIYEVCTTKNTRNETAI